MKRTPNGWDKRDYELWSAIQQLTSYGLIAGDADNIMISRKETLALLETHAEQRYANTAGTSTEGGKDGTSKR